MNNRIITLIFITLATFSNFAFGQKNIGIQLPYYVDNPAAVQKIPEDTVEVRCEYCLGEMILGNYGGCAPFLSFNTDMEEFRHYYRKPLDSLLSSRHSSFFYVSVIAILDTVPVELRYGKLGGFDSIKCFFMIIWNMGEYFDTNCQNYNVDHFPDNDRLETDSEITPHLDSVYLYVIKDEISSFFEMIKDPVKNKFLFSPRSSKFKGHSIYYQFFTQNTFDIANMYSFAQLKRYYLKNKHRGHTFKERKKNGTHYYTICD
ncbi:MAG: hypothetical protein IJQ89_04415 [Bacteroidales bacterium]|nr:hypothetical protein [Bacteroidales bacterium]